MGLSVPCGTDTYLQWRTPNDICYWAHVFVDDDVNTWWGDIAAGAGGKTIHVRDMMRGG